MNTSETATTMNRAGRHGRWLGLLLLATVTGCRTTPPADEWHGTAARDLAPVLVLAPLTPTAATAEASARLGEFLLDELARATQGQAVLADRIPTLRPFISWQALTLNGDLNPADLRGVGKAAQCATVVAGILQESRPYAPQRLTLRLMLVNVSSGTVTRQLHLCCDLGDPAVQKDFAAFVHHDRTLLTRLTEGGNDDVYAATLMPRVFQQYVAARGVQRLLGRSP